MSEITSSPKANISHEPKVITDIIRKAEANLEEINPSPFSPNAFAVLKFKIAEYISDLVSESIKVSKRHRADTVSAAHVDRASEYLVSSTSRRLFRHIGTVGGILLGAAISTILAMTIAGQFTTFSAFISIALGIIGAFMIA